MKPKISVQYFKHPYAEFILGTFNGQLCLCDFRFRKLRNTVDKRIQQGLNATFSEQNNQVLEQTKTQLEAYFMRQRNTFDLPLLYVVTEFQQSVWHALREVKYGATTTYKELATDVGRPTAVRPVASANGANALAIIVPCHRVIGSNGELVGYGGGLALKRQLLELEIFSTPKGASRYSELRPRRVHSGSPASRAHLF